MPATSRSGGRWIWKRNTGVYWFQIAVPKRLQGVFQKHIIQETLGTRSEPIALRKAAERAAYWKDQFAQADGESGYAPPDMFKRLAGNVYIIVNENFPGWVKIGCATRPEARLAGYQTADPHRSYRLDFVAPADDQRHAEWLAHEELKRRGIPYSAEWFQVDDLALVRRVVAKAAATKIDHSLPQKEQSENSHCRRGDERLPAAPSAG